MSLNGLAGSDMLHAAVAQARSLSDLIGQRSPGERTAAELTKTRHARALAKMHARPRGIAKTAPTEFATILLPPPSEVSLDVAPPLPMAALMMPPAVAGLGSLPSGGGGVMVSSPGGGGGIVPPGTDSLPSEPREPVSLSAVPEPGTWALMLLGFGLIGWRARRTRSALQTA